MWVFTFVVGIPRRALNWRPGGGAESGSRPTQKAAQRVDAENSDELQNLPEVFDHRESTPLDASRDFLTEIKWRECMGIEPNQHSPKISTNRVPGGAKSGALVARTPAIDRDLATI